MSPSKLFYEAWCCLSSERSHDCYVAVLCRLFKVCFLLVFSMCFVLLLSLSLWTYDMPMIDVDQVSADAYFRRLTETAGNMEDKLQIAIGGGITSRGVANVSEQSDFVAKFVFFKTFLPTFCSTACTNFTYRFYFAFNYNDTVFANQTLAAKFQRTFASQIQMLCVQARGVWATLNLVKVNYTGMPAWAQNDAMMEAYMDNVDYFFRINDDTQMITSEWTSSFIRVLEGYDPPRVGVVGPNHGGNTTEDVTGWTMQYDFVHRTHVDMFGFYYPRCFTDWWADHWITLVYRPSRSTVMQNIRLQHTRALGTRYQLVLNNRDEEFEKDLNDGQLVLNRYISAIRARNESGEPSIAPDGRRIIAMTLYGRKLSHTWGVIRNAQLVRVYFPKWRLRVYVPSTKLVVPGMTVPTRCIRKLRLLGAEIVHVTSRFGITTHSSYPPRDWRLLVAEDQNVDYFLIRDAESRFNDREASAIDEWIAEVERHESVGLSDSFAVHCIRDHPSHADRAIVDGLWGGRPRVLRRRLGNRLTKAFYWKMIMSNSNKANSTEQRIGPKTPLEEVLWPLIVGDKATAMFHDVVSPCGRWTTTTTTTNSTVCRATPMARSDHDYMGQRYNEHEQLIDAGSSVVELQ